MVTFQPITALRSIFKPNPGYFRIIIVVVALFSQACASKKDVATSPDKALQQYLECKNQKDTQCIYNLLPGILMATARDAARDIKVVRKKIKDTKTLECLAQKAYLKKDVLQVDSGKDILFYAMALKNRKVSGFVGDVRHAVKYGRYIGNKKNVYRALTYEGEQYTIKKDGNGRYHVVPQNKVRRRINQIGASAALLRLLANKPCPGKSKTK